jgi:hypothetical protein
MKIITHAEHQAYNSGSDEFYESNLPLVISGKLQLEDFLIASAMWDNRAKELVAICTSDFSAYELFFRMIFPDKSYPEILRHEHRHAEVAIKYNLKPSYCAIIACNVPLIFVSDKGLVPVNPRSYNELYSVRPFVIDGLSEGATNWDLKKFLQYLKENTTTDLEMSTADALIAEKLKSIRI